MLKYCLHASNTVAVSNPHPRNTFTNSGHQCSRREGVRLEPREMKLRAGMKTR